VEIEGNLRCTPIVTLTTVCPSAAPASKHDNSSQQLNPAHKTLGGGDASNGSGHRRSCVEDSGTVGVNCSQMSDRPKRFLCRLQLSEEITLYACGRCTWTYRVEGNDTDAGQAAFDEHRCEDFPLPPILLSTQL
jgi:hypothetical protein